MLLLATVTVSVHMLNVLRNVAFMMLTCGALGASLHFSLKGRKIALSWFLCLTVGSVTLFAVSLSHLKHQMLELAPASQSSPSSTGATLESTVRQSGDAVMKACLMAAGVYIVLQGLWLLVLFSRTRVPNAPVIIVRFFVGALICLGILGIGLLGRRADGMTAPEAKGVTKKTERYLPR
jgi:hypothetical protein